MKKDVKYDIDEICRYCEHSALLSGGDDVLCDKKGVVAATHKCKYFTLDVIKLEPKRQKNVPAFEYVDIDERVNIDGEDK